MTLSLYSCSFWSLLIFLVQQVRIVITDFPFWTLPGASPFVSPIERFFLDTPIPLCSSSLMATIVNEQKHQRTTYSARFSFPNIVLEWKSNDGLHLVRGWTTYSLRHSWDLVEVFNIFNSLGTHFTDHYHFYKPAEIIQVWMIGIEGLLIKVNMN